MNEKEYQEVINAAHLSRYGTVAREVAARLRSEAATPGLAEELAAKLESVRTDTIEIMDLRFQGRPPIWAPKLAKALGVAETTPIQALLDRVATLSGENMRAAIARGDDDGQPAAYESGLAKGRAAAYTIVGGLLGMTGSRDASSVFRAVGELLKAEAAFEQVRSEMQAKIDTLELALTNERNKIAFLTGSLEELVDAAQTDADCFDEDGKFEASEDDEEGEIDTEHYDCDCGVDD